MSLAQAALVAAGYWFTNSAFNANLGFNLLRWPLAAGMIVGWIMGDLEKGILIGASINLVFLGSIWAGASQPSDPALAGWLGTAIALAGHLGPVESVAIAAALGFLDLLGMGNRMRVDVAFAHKAAEAAERGSIRGVAFWNWAPAQLYVFVSTFIPALILAQVGAAAISVLYGAIDPGRGGSPDLRWIRDGLVIAGSLLMALGVGINLSRMLTSVMIPYFLIFFTVAALTHANIAGLAVVAAALAFMHVMLFSRRKSQDFRTAACETGSLAPAGGRMSEPTKRITRRDIFASWWRWLFFAHANYNWESYQATGFAHAMSPIIRKLYQDPDEIRAALKRHLVLFSTDPEIGGVIHGMVIALEERHASGDATIDDAAINNLKTNLMGPVGALGDTLKQGLWFPVWQAIGIGIALSTAGSVTGILGPLVFIVAALLYTLVFGWLLYYQGYLQGQSLMARLLNSSLLDDIRTGGAVLGTAVLAALGAETVSVQTGITWTSVSGAGAAAVRQTVDLQTQFLDVLYPSLLPLLTILGIFWLLRRGASGVSVTLYLFGFAFAAALLEAVSRYTIQGGAFGMFSPSGLPALLGILVLFSGAFTVGRREQNAAGAMGFVAGFLVVAVLVDLLSLGRTDPLQLLAHM